MTSEQWSPVPGHEDYEVNSIGQIRSWKQSGRGAHKRADSPHLLRCIPPWSKASRRHGPNYWRVYIDGKYRYLHNVVLETFIGGRPLGMEGAHLDGDRNNNAISNLTWATHQENEAHKVLHGTKNVGDRNGMSARRRAERACA